MSKVKGVPEKLVDELSSASQQLDAVLVADPADSAKQPMKILYSEKGPENPIAELDEAKAGFKAYSGDYWGTFSLENFYSAGSLRYTHDDAWGWLDYVDQFHPANFRYLDQNVRIWAYYETYDNWQDTYGMDAVLAVYHSGHGGMAGDGKFYVPLGDPWGGLGTTACSDQMRLGNEQVRYIFWSTCVSCRVLNGHSPIRTWHPANLGFRMLFGYETVSWDDPDYGSAFWKHWNKGKSFSTAFMDASWYDVAHDQAPAVVACGATREEAIDRVFNERNFYWGAASRSWYWWRWYNAASSATDARALNKKMPDELLIAELQPRTVDGNYVSSVLARHDVPIGLPDEVQASANGVFRVQEGDMRAAFESDGSYELQLAQPNRKNKDQISVSSARGIAEDFVQRQGLGGQDLMFDRILLSQEAGGSPEGSGQIEGPYTTETTVQFTQVINGLPVLLPEKGYVSVTVDNDGTVTNVKNATRSIAQLTDRFKNTPVAPDDETADAGPLDPEQLLAEAWQVRMKDWIVHGKMPVQFSYVPNTKEIGYTIKGNEAILVIRTAVEVDYGDGYKKRYWVEVPLLE